MDNQFIRVDEIQRLYIIVAIPVGGKMVMVN